MKTLMLASLVLVGVSVQAADPVWQHGVWRDQFTVQNAPSSLTVPIGTMAMTFPSESSTEFVIVEGEDGMQYVAKAGRHQKDVIVNDPIDFTIDGNHLVVRGPKPKQIRSFKLVKRIRVRG